MKHRAAALAASAALLVAPSARAHLLISEVGYDTADETGATSEFVEIFNPGPGDVDLGAFFLVNAEHDYPKVVSGPLSSGDIPGSDFIFKFPTAILPAGGVAVVTHDSDAFLGEFFGGALGAFQGQPGAPLLFEGTQDGNADGVPDMIQGWFGTPANNMSLANAGECVGIVGWDFAGDVVTDHDWVCWNTVTALPTKSIDFPGGLDGPDVDTSATPYQPDLGTGVPAPAATQGTSIQRPSLAEPGELTSGGNGVSGHDETTEDWSTWSVAAYTPGTADLCSALTDACATFVFDPNAGTCVASPTDCGDADLCTTDACDPSLGCQHAAVSCDDGIDCTIDGCVASTGCTHLDMCGAGGAGVGGSGGSAGGMGGIGGIGGGGAGGGAGAGGMAGAGGGGGVGGSTGGMGGIGGAGGRGGAAGGGVGGGAPSTSSSGGPGGGVTASSSGSGRSGLGDDNEGVSSEENSGCGCRTVGPPDDQELGALGLALLLVALRRRRRSHS